MIDVDDTLIFVDGENLSMRYQEMIKAGRTPAPDNLVIENCFVWNNRILQDHQWKIKRLSYYTSVIGDDDKVNEVRQQISSTVFTCFRGMGASKMPQTGQLVPFVSKKSSRSRKESVCDIAIAVDVMRACYRDHADTVWLFSGDGDFIQLFQEVLHSGKKAYASALSSGLNSEIPFVVDEFLLLDKYLFVDESADANAASN